MMERYEIETVLEYLDDYVKASFDKRESPSVETEVDWNRKRSNLVDYLMELLNQ